MTLSPFVFSCLRTLINLYFFFFNDTATTEIYTLSLHDALPIWPATGTGRAGHCTDNRIRGCVCELLPPGYSSPGDRKSTRLNSSHGYISYAVFCLKKKKKQKANIADRLSLYCLRERIVNNCAGF